jgi:hypothetical protein
VTGQRGDGRAGSVRYVAECLQVGRADAAPAGQARSEKLIESKELGWLSRHSEIVTQPVD